MIDLSYVAVLFSTDLNLFYLMRRAESSLMYGIANIKEFVPVPFSEVACLNTLLGAFEPWVLVANFNVCYRFNRNLYGV